MTAIKIYDAHNIHTLEWPQTPDGDYARSVLLPLLHHGTRAFIENVDVQIFVLSCGDTVFPLVVSKPESRMTQSYVCSPTTHYIDYARVELEIELSEQPLLKAGLDHMIRSIGQLFERLSFEKVVYVNNWLLSTNLYPDFEPHHFAEIRDFLIQAFPEHVLMFRSVNLELNGEIYQTLRQEGFEEIISRQVYILDPSNPAYLKTKCYKEDLRLAKKSPYRWISHQELSPSDVPRLRNLYDQLYLKKYSTLNPQFTELFIRQSLKEGWLKFWALTHQGRMDACIGYFVRNGVMTTPMVGYEFEVPRKAGLYRMITLKMIQESAQNGWVLNNSSGVSQFKRNRGCEPSLEYNLVYMKHLSRAQQSPWRVLKSLSKRVAVPILERFEL